MIGGETDAQIVTTRATDALDGNLHPWFHDRSRSLTDHPCNGTSGTGKPACSARYWDASLRSDGGISGPLYSIRSSSARASRLI